VDLRPVRETGAGQQLRLTRTVRTACAMVLDRTCEGLRRA
jgi:hypothetical protein